MADADDVLGVGGDVPADGLGAGVGAFAPPDDAAGAVCVFRLGVSCVPTPECTSAGGVPAGAS